MVGFGDALKGAVRESISSILDVADTALSYGRALSYAADRYAEAANWLRRKIGDTPPGEDIPPLESPFEGGQCPVEYEITTSGTTTSGNPGLDWTDRMVTAFGPLQGIEFYNGSANGVFIRDASNNLITLSSTTSILWGYSLTSISVVRIDGQPDECGNPIPPGFPDEIPEEGYTGGITVIWDDRDTVTVTEEGDITIYAPVFSVDGSINIPITVDIGGITLEGHMDVTNNLEVTLNPRTGDRITRRPTITLPSPPDVPEAGDAINVVLARNAIAGVVVRSEVLPECKATYVVQDEAPVLYVPRLANVYFVYKVGSSYAWSQPYPVVNINQLITVPFDFSAYAYYVWEDVGVNCTVYPVSGNLVPIIPEP